MVFPRERPEFLNSLCKMCYRQRSLPKSMVITHFPDLSEIPQCGGGSADVYRCEYAGRHVAVKVIRVYLSRDRDREQSVGTAFRAPRQKGNS